MKNRLSILVMDIFEKIFRRFLLFIFIFIISIFTASATNYFVDATNGDDNNNGVSSDSPWKSISKVNRISFMAGDTIFFLRGEQWNERLRIDDIGNSARRIIFSAYGNGNNPSIRGIIVSNSKYVTIQQCTIEGYSSSGEALLIADNADYITIANCIVQNNAKTAISVWTPNRRSHVLIKENLIRNNGWVNERSQGIFIASLDGIIEENTIYHNAYGDKTYGYSHGIYIDQGSLNIEISNNRVYDCLRGHGIQIKGNAKVYKNLVYNNAAAGIYFGENGSNNITGTIHSNILYGNRIGILQMQKGSGDLTMKIFHNTLYHNRVGNEWTAEILIEDNITSLIITNNIIHPYSDANAYNIVVQSVADLDYNCVYSPNLENIVSYADKERTWDYWQNTVKFDINSINYNPQFIDPTLNNYRLKTSSPCINAGIDVGVVEDFEDTSIPQGIAPDMGAYEYSNSKSSIGIPHNLWIEP